MSYTSKLSEMNDIALLVTFLFFFPDRKFILISHRKCTSYSYMHCKQAIHQGIDKEQSIRRALILIKQYFAQSLFRWAGEGHVE